MFDALNPSLQILCVVTWTQRQHATQDARTSVKFSCHEVHGGAVLRVASLYRSLMGV